MRVALKIWRSDAATGDPSKLLPPLAYETVARDIGDQVFQRLADLAPGGTPIDASAYRPALAARWERVDVLVGLDPPAGASGCVKNVLPIGLTPNAPMGSVAAWAGPTFPSL